MFKPLNKTLILIFSVWGFIWFALSGTVSGQDKSKMGGWELGSPYNSFYKAAELDSFKGTLEEIKEVVPLPGMSPCVALVVSESKKEKVLVHVAPSWFLDAKKIGLKKGDRIKVRGVWAEINGKDVFMANKITRGENFFVKVRLTKDGTPFWTMSPERLAKERAAD